MTLVGLGGGFVFAYYPVFWSIPTILLSESAAAATFGFINSLGQAGGFFGPYIVGDLNMRTGSHKSGFAFIACCYILAAFFVARLKLLASTGAVAEPVTRPSNSATT